MSIPKIGIKIENNNKLGIILQNYNSLSNRADLLIKTSYEVGFGAITTAALVITFSVLSGERAMIYFCVIPFILFIGAIVYCHIIQTLFMYFRDMMIIEHNIEMNLPNDEMASNEKMMALGTVSRLGYFSSKYIYNMSGSIKTMFWIFSGGYLGSAVIGLSFFSKTQVFIGQPDLSSIVIFSTMIMLFFPIFIWILLCRTAGLMKDYDDTLKEFEIQHSPSWIRKNLVELNSKIDKCLKKLDRLYKILKDP